VPVVDDVEPPSTQATSAKKQKKNMTNTLGKNLKMRLEIMVPPDEEEQELNTP